jgi:5-methylthioadenosine/S-adenosylhomocysteine deaminase
MELQTTLGMPMKSVDLMISARWILPIAPKNIILENHSVIVNQGRIIEVLPTDLAEDEYEAASHRVLNNHIVMPGLINAHTHTPMNLFRGMADDLELMDWLNNYIWPAEKEVINAESVAIGCRLAIAEMLRGGTTCFNDHYFFGDVIANTAIEEGIRTVVGNPIMNVPTDWATTEDEYIQKARTTITNFPKHPLISWNAAPHAPYTNSDSSLAKANTLNAEFGMVTHMHLHETQSEIDIDMGLYNKRPIKRLHDLGLLHERFIAVHMTTITSDEIDLIASTGTHVVHCPESNMKLASGFSPVQKMMDKGINVALGTDGAASNNDLDMFGEMRTAAFIAKGHSGDSTALPCDKVLEMATINGAKALGLADETGSLEEGKSADIIAIDMSDYCVYPTYNPMSHLVYAVNRMQVKDVWIQGEQLLHQGELTRLNIEKTMSDAEVWVSKIKAIATKHHQAQKDQHAAAV